MRSNVHAVSLYIHKIAGFATCEVLIILWDCKNLWMNEIQTLKTKIKNVQPKPKPMTVIKNTWPVKPNICLHDLNFKILYNFSISYELLPVVMRVCSVLQENMQSNVLNNK